MDQIVVVTITASRADWLAAFTRRLVDGRLVAGGTVVPNPRSIFRWRGAVEDRAEAGVGTWWGVVACIWGGTG